ncbi:UNVERIFIED_CONTAM: hypothetical protein Slati_0718600 [Sesamum latifolium]|uniref:RIN4 pathogenic type III effector avirulence factor Avr cleavage site domain-containing protein n=1 Tax=Sesamum latifolium TaxID=2727402 RepID=A0AAW2Y578_9LAMI
MSVPEFGGWDGKSETNYSVVFSQARAHKKKHKSEVPPQAHHHNSLGNEFELPPQPQDHRPDVHPFSTPPMKNRMSVPEFGGWNGKSEMENNYTVVFTHARANRKKHKSEIPPTPLGNEFEFPALHPNDGLVFSTMFR